MSLWQCANHGLVGPDRCCASASRATVTTPDPGIVYDWRIVPIPRPPPPPKFTKRELEWMRCLLEAHFAGKPQAIGRAHAASIIAKIDKSIVPRRPSEVTR